jgi:hypothetical protein
MFTLPGRKFEIRLVFFKIMISTIIRSIVGNEELIKKLLKDEKIIEAISKISSSEEAEKAIESMLADENIRTSFSTLVASTEFNDFLKYELGNEGIRTSAANLFGSEEFKGFIKAVGLRRIFGIKK